jgi:hypothetical protein
MTIPVSAGSARGDPPVKRRLRQTPVPALAPGAGRGRRLAPAREGGVSRPSPRHGDHDLDALAVVGEEGLDVTEQVVGSDAGASRQ